MPALTTTTRFPYAACSRRDNAFGQRSSPFKVDAVPSVMESPNATITCVSDGSRISTASRKYQDVVVKGNAASSSACPFAPAPGALRYDVVSPFACHVIGPLSPTTWKLTASLAPGAAAGIATPSLHTDSPGAIVTAGFPLNLTARFVPATTAPPARWMPAKTPS